MSVARKRARHRRSMAIQLSLAGLAMFGFGFALVPLYEVICDITGLNGQSASTKEASVVETVAAVDESRQVRVEFTTTVNSMAGWQFAPEQDFVTVHPGALTTVNFVAVNKTKKETVAQATPSIAPWAAARHFRKTECFCFEQQPFLPGEEKLMPVTFVVDQELPKTVDTVTLSYTFFDITEVASAQ